MRLNVVLVASELDLSGWLCQISLSIEIHELYQTLKIPSFYIEFLQSSRLMFSNNLVDILYFTCSSTL